MADNTILNAGSGGDTLRTDDNAGVKTPVTKIELGVDGSFDGFVSATNPMPISDNSGSLTVDNGGTFAVQVDAALPAGTNAIGKLAANSGVDIGDVDVISIIPGTAATNLGKAVDSAAGATDTGVALLAIRDDALTTLTPVDGDYVGLRVGSTGALWVGVSGTVTVDGSGVTQPVSNAALTELAAAINSNRVDVNIAAESASVTVDAANDGSLNVTIGDGSNTATIRNLASNDALNVAIVDSSGNQVTSFGGSGGTSATDDSAFTAGSGSGTPVMGFFSADTVNAGDVGVLAMDASRRLFVSLEVDNVGLATAANQSTGNSSLSTIAGAVSGSEMQVDVVSSALPTGAATAANQSTANASLSTIAGDTTSLDAKITACNTGAVVISSGSVTADLGANNDVQGAAAHDAAVSGNPFLHAGEARTSEGTAVANGDVVRMMADVVGKLINQPYAPSDLHWQATGSKTDTSDLALKAAAGAGVRNYITDIVIANSSSTDTTAILKDGSTEIARFPVPANGGVVHRFGVPLKTTANTALNIASAGSVSTMYFTASGYTGR